MFIYIFLLAAAAASTELSLTNVEMVQELQEIVTLLSSEENMIESTVTNSETSITNNASPQVQAQPISITNAIEPTMLEYKHWTGKYSPDEFNITVNGTIMEVGNKCEIPANSTTVEIGYTYSFMSGMKSGGRKISYQLNENITQARITFDWKNDWRVILDNGKAIQEINV